VLENITALVQARFGSSRLPGKVLKKIGRYTILERVVKNILLTRCIKEVIVITSTSKDDNKIVDLCKKKKIKYFRGPLNNVAKRYFQALKKKKLGCFMRISADSPFILPSLIDQLANIMRKGKYDIVTNILKRSYPKGQSIEIFKRNIFLNNFKKFRKKDLEHVTTFFYRNQKNFIIYNQVSKKNCSLFNLSVDNISDYKRAKFISARLNNLYKIKPILDLYKKYEKN